MHKLSEKFNSSKSKMLLTLAILATTSGALFNDLNAQTTNNGGKAKMEQVDKNDAQRVANFTKPLGVTIPANWIKFASDAIQILDAEGIASAQMILSQDLPKVKNEDKAAYILMAFDAIRKAYDKEDHMEAATEFAVEYVTYGDGITSITTRFADDRQKRSEAYITQTQQEINQKKENINQKKENISNMDREINQKKENINQKKENISNMDREINQKKENINQKKENISNMDREINQNRQEINQNRQEINQNRQEISQNRQEISQKNQEAEARLVKLYNLNPNDTQLKTLASNAKKNFINTNYKYSEKTAEIFAKLGIK